MCEDINSELKKITNNLSILDSVDTFRQREISKVILDDINSKIRSTLNLNQWKNKQSVINGFRAISDKPNYTYHSFDILNFIHQYANNSFISQIIN